MASKLDGSVTCCTTTFVGFVTTEVGVDTFFGVEIGPEYGIFLLEVCVGFLFQEVCFGIAQLKSVGL